MTSTLPTIQFFEGIPEELSSVSLRRNANTGVRILCLTFTQLQAIERFNSYRKEFKKALLLSDTEGDISVEPASMKFIFGGPEGDDLQRVECKIEIDRDDHWDRLMRFMQRYAEANGMEYGERSTENQS